MIDIVIYKKSDSIIGFRTGGHAQFDNYGNDIVCSSISILAINTVNSIEAFTEDQLTVLSDDNGLIDLLVKNQLSQETKVLLKAFELGVTSVYDEYGKSYINIRIEEV